MDQHEFCENEDGVHLVSMNDVTLCGDAYEGSPPLELERCEEDDFGEMQPTDKQTVTCHRCIAIILHCRGVRVYRRAGHKDIYA